MEPSEAQLESLQEPVHALEPSEITKLATLLFDHIEGQIKAADSKAWLISAANALLANVFKDLGKNMIYTLLYASDPFQRISSLFALLMFVSIVGSIFFALWTVKPTLKNPVKETFFYFGNIKRLSEQDFIQRFHCQQSDKISEALLTEVYTKAAIADRKFQQLNKSLYFFFAALVCWVLAQLTLAFIRQP